MTAQRFRSRVVGVEAHPYDGTPESAAAIVNWTRGYETYAWLSGATLIISTLEGPMTASPGDWIIRGTQGEHYPCKPYVFAIKYEPCADNPDSAAEFEVPYGDNANVAKRK